MNEDHNNSPANYIPISCHFYDRLEAWSTLKKKVEIKYVNSEGKVLTTTGHINDLRTRQKIEYLELENGLEIRLDQLIEVDGYELK